jgi:hypothetical protein
MAANANNQAMPSRPITACRARQKQGSKSVQKCGLLDMGEHKSMRSSTTLYSRHSMAGA